MPGVVKVILAVVAFGASLALALLAFVTLIYAFSNEMPRDSVLPTAVAGFAFAAISFGLFALAVWLVWSVFRAPR